VVAEQKLRQFNEEIGDCWHFILEFIIYADLEDEICLIAKDVFIEGTGGEPQFELVPGNELPYLYAMAEHINMLENIKEDARNKFSIGKTELGFEGGSDLGPRTLEFWWQGCWTMTIHLLGAIHSLKHKPWAQSKLEANMIKFHDEMGHFIISVMQLMAIVGKKPDSIRESYRLVNEKNRQRIKGKY
jgi:hypothetical protein